MNELSITCGQPRLYLAPPGVFPEDPLSCFGTEESNAWQWSSLLQTIWMNEAQTLQVIGPQDHIQFLLTHPNAVTSTEYMSSDSWPRELPPGNFERFTRVVDSEVLNHLKGLIRLAYIPARWKEQGILNPTERCREVSLGTARDIYAEYGLLPAKVTASKQEGIILIYRDANNGRSLAIEIDNELDAVAVVSDDKEVIASGVFDGNEIDRLVKLFSAELASPPCNKRPAIASERRFSCF